MPIRGTFLLPSSITKTLVCIDTVNAAEFGGRFYNRYLPNSVEFSGAFDLVNKMDGIFDYFEFPHPYFQIRTFHADCPKFLNSALPKNLTCYQDEAVFIKEKGKKMTLLLQVCTRKNATWQGMALWVEKECAVHFQSIQELMRFIIGSLSAVESGLRFVGWGKKSR